MHPYFFSLLYRERLAQFEREAEYRRHFPKEAKQANHRFKRFASALTRSRRTAPTAAPVASEAHPCL
jgi:hypothetical protein